MPKHSNNTKMILHSLMRLIALAVLCENLLFIDAQTTSQNSATSDSSVANQTRPLNHTTPSPATIAIHRSEDSDTEDAGRPRESLMLSKDEFVDYTEAPTLLFDNTSDEAAPSSNNSDSASSSSPGANATSSTAPTSAPSTTTTAPETEGTTTVRPEANDSKNATSSPTDDTADDGADDEDGAGEDSMEDTKDNVKPFEPPKNISQYMDYIETLFHDLRHQITDLFEPHIPQLIRTSQQVQLSGSCSYDMLRLALALRQFEPWALRMIDSSGKVPEGIFEGSFTALGSYDECLSTVFASSSTTPNNQQASPATSPVTSAGEKSHTQGKYCLVAVSPFMPPKPPADRIEHLFQEEASKRNHSKVSVIQ